MKKNFTNVGRDIVEVASKIKGLSEEKGADTRFLDDIISNASFTAPEDMGKRWNELALFVNQTVPFPPKEEQDLKIVAEFVNISLEEAKIRFPFQNY